MNESEYKFSSPDVFGPVEWADTYDLVQSGDELANRLQKVLDQLPDSAEKKLFHKENGKITWKLSWTHFDQENRLKHIYIWPSYSNTDEIIYSLKYDLVETNPPTFYAAVFDDKRFREEKNSVWALDNFKLIFDKLIHSYAYEKQHAPRP